jgi:hypothetical protein
MLVGSGALLAVFELSRYPSRISATVEDSTYSNRVRFNLVVDRKRESITQAPIKSTCLPMNSRVKNQGIDVRENAVEKIVANTRALTLVEAKPREQIPIRGSRNADLHLARRRSDFLATSQSINSSFPARTLASVARSSSRCHCGDSKPAFLVKSVHSASIARNFSSFVIDLRGSVVGIC